MEREGRKKGERRADDLSTMMEYDHDAFLSMKILFVFWKMWGGLKVLVMYVFPVFHYLTLGKQSMWGYMMC